MDATNVTIPQEEYERLRLIEEKFDELTELVKPLAEFAASFGEGRKIKKPAPRKRETKAEAKARAMRKIHGQ